MLAKIVGVLFCVAILPFLGEGMFLHITHLDVLYLIC